MKLSVKDAAQLLNVSQKSIYRWIKRSAIPAYQISDQYRFNRAELIQWASSRRMAVSPEIFSETDDAQITLADALAAGGIHYRVGGADKASVLRLAGDLMNLPSEVDRGFLHSVLVARERLCSSALGDGVAAAHPPSPIVPNVDRPMAALCFLERAVEWQSPDGRAVRAVFVLLSPTLRGQLCLSSQLSFALRNGVFKSVLARQAGRDEVIGAIQPPAESVSIQSESFEHLD